MSLIEIGLCGQNMITILGSVVNIIERDLYKIYVQEYLDFDKE